MGLFGKSKKEEKSVIQEIVEGIGAFQKELEGAKGQREHDKISEQEFTLLLSGVSTCRKAPGIPVHMGYEELYHCVDEEAAGTVRAHLERIFGISDRESLEEVFGHSQHDEYIQFLSFWNGEPIFDENQLDPAGRKVFQNCKDFAEHFRPLVGDKGFYAWDCSEQIGMYRKACACGILSDEEFWEMALPLARRAARWFASWEEYAISCLCGAIYFDFRNGCGDEELKKFLELNLNLVRHLFEPGGAWERSGWFRLPEKKYAITGDQIRELLTGWEGADGCIATDRIVVDGCKVGYMYRTEPCNGWDSGWRFFAGDESPDYVDCAEHSGIYKLNTICNYDPDILPFLKAPYGTAYGREEEGTFIEEPLNE